MITVPTVGDKDQPWYLARECKEERTGLWTVAVRHADWERDDRAILCRAHSVEAAREDAWRLACRLNEGEHIQEGTETSGDEVMGLGVLIDAPHGTVQYVPTDSPAAVEWAKARGAVLAAAGQSSPSSYPCSTSTSEDGWRVVVHYDDRVAPATARDALRAAAAVLQPESKTEEWLHAV